MSEKAPTKKWTVFFMQSVVPFDETETVNPLGTVGPGVIIGDFFI